MTIRKRLVTRRRCRLPLPFYKAAKLMANSRWYLFFIKLLSSHQERALKQLKLQHAAEASALPRKAARA